jgi:acetyl-CoA acyltransferase 1
MERISRLSNNITSNQKQLNGLGSVGVKRDDDVVIVSALRTPMTRAKKGPLRQTAPEMLLSHVFKSTLERTKLDPKLVEDVQVGNVLMPGAGAFNARAAMFLSGMATETPCSAVNRQCSSGLEACALIAAKIKAGLIECGIGAGVESMSLFDMNGMVDPEKLSEEIFENTDASNCMLPMGLTSENVCEKYGLQRDKLDQFAYESHMKALNAQRLGYFAKEIVPIKVKLTDKEGNEKELLVEHDDGIRPKTTVERLAKLKPSFKKGGLSTAGNSSQVTDGAAAVLLMTRRLANQLGLKVLGKFISHAVVGVPPEIMGIGPAVAIPRALEIGKLCTHAIDVFQINEAFASQCTYSRDVLKIDPKKVNPKGGAIALGHPLGCTGAREFATLLEVLQREKKKLGVISMCIGTGMGAAAVIEAEH